jgi:hypothetical protein
LSKLGEDILPIKGLIFTGGTVGDCLVDSFTLTSPGNQASPVICGFNTGQHSEQTEF